MIPVSLLVPGLPVRIIESNHTSNWTRIDLGRTGTIVDIRTFQFRSEPGPQVQVLVRYDTRERWDRKGKDPVIVHCHPSQLDLQPITA